MRVAKGAAVAVAAGLDKEEEEEEEKESEGPHSIWHRGRKSIGYQSCLSGKGREGKGEGEGVEDDSARRRVWVESKWDDDDETYR